MKGSVESDLEYVQDGISTVSWALAQLFAFVVNVFFPMHLIP